MERTTMRTLWLLGTLLVASFVNQVNCESTVEIGGGATATGGGSTSSTTSSTTTQTSTIISSSQEGPATAPAPAPAPSPSPLPPSPSPSPPPFVAPAPPPASSPAPAPGGSTSSASAVAISSGGSTSTYTSTTETSGGGATAVAQTTVSAPDVPAETEAEESGASDLEDDMEMPSADEEISSRSGGDLDIVEDVGTKEEKFDPSKLPVCEGIPKFRCCDDQDFISADDRKFCGCWGNDSIEGCDYEVENTASPLVIKDLRALFGDGRCRCQEPEEVIYDECFGRTKSSCCDNIDEKAKKCRCLFGTDRCIYVKGKNGVWKNTLFSSGDCVCPKS